MKKAKRQKWFRAKTYGYGWYPAAWQGWIVTLTFIFMIVLTMMIFQFLTLKFPEIHNFIWVYLIIVFSLSGTLVYIAYKKGERARWQWGK